MKLKNGILTGNQLKLIALIAMTLDHIGKMLLPGFPILQIIGRLAFPIFAYMIAEGCTYTRNRKKYLLTMIVAAFICEIFYIGVMKWLYQCILVTFSLSIGLIYTLDIYLKNKKSIKNALPFTALLIVTFILSEILPVCFPKTGFGIDYGFFGIMLPVLVYAAKGKKEKLIAAAIPTVLIAVTTGGIQWFSLAALILLALYNGERGTAKIKNLFYIYYPAHLVIIYLIWRYVYLLIRLFR